MSLKRDSPREVVDDIDILEKQADRWGQSHVVLKKEWNLAAWHGLTACARALELDVPLGRRGGSSHQTSAMNLSHAGYQIYHAALRHGHKQAAPQRRMRWSLSEVESKQLVLAGFSYSLCWADFPAWHSNLYNLVSHTSSSITFAAATSEHSQRVMAYEKGIRPFGDRGEFGKQIAAEDTGKAFSNALAKVSSEMRAAGTKGFVEPPLHELHDSLFPIYLAKIGELFRRAENIALGGYSMGEFRRFQAALLCIAGTREHLCYVWSQKTGKIPCNNLLLLMTLDKWTTEICRLSALSSDLVAQIIDGLTLGQEEVPNRDLNVYPFIPLNSKGDLLAVVPGIVMTSNIEESILRNRAYRNKRFFDAATSVKEDETRIELQRELSHMHIYGPLKLSNGMPDIDVIFEDPKSNALLVAELKWLQMPGSLPARAERNREIEKGVRQVRFIRDFLNTHPDYLLKQGKLERSLNIYDSVSFCVLCRDYIGDIASGDVPIFSYIAFKNFLKNGESLPAAIAHMKSDAWLPSQGRDFTYGLYTHNSNGVMISTEVLKTTYANELNLLENT
ncbi:hypothetical protein [Terriglobus saanensis]|nr:hypothetical protein [Terriglobus saanensis]